VTEVVQDDQAVEGVLLQVGKEGREIARDLGEVHAGLIAALGHVLYVLLPNVAQVVARGVAIEDLVHLLVDEIAQLCDQPLNEGAFAWGKKKWVSKGLR